MTPPTHQLTSHSNLKLKDLILDLLSTTNSILTLDEILTGVKKTKTPYLVNKKVIRNLVNKLVRKGVVEYVYIDLSYGIRLVDFLYNDNTLEAAT